MLYFNKLKITLASLFISLILSPIYSSVAYANDKVVVKSVKETIKNPVLIGKGRYSYLFWDVFDAKLYAPNGKWSPNKAFALDIKYLLDVDGDDIASNGIDEMRSQGFTNEKTLQRWYKKMVNIFKEVKSGTNVTGVRDEQGYAKFYKNGRYIGIIREKLFAKHFFNIWLGKNTSAKDLRKSLINY